MKTYRAFSLVLFLILVALITNAPSQSPGANALKPAEIKIPNAPISTRVLMESPADTETDLQIICLFESTPQNTLHGSLIETNEKLKGLLDKLRNPSLFRGELGETLVIVPPAGTLRARKLLIIGLGDSENFTPQRLELVASIAYNESTRLGVAHPFFAPTVFDGGVTKYSTGQASESFIAGFLRAARTEKVLEAAGTSTGQVLQDLTYLAGPAHATDTAQGMERAFAAARQN